MKGAGNYGGGNRPKVSIEPEPLGAPTLLREINSEIKTEACVE